MAFVADADAVFDPFPVLRTPRLHLRRMVPDDADALFDVFAHEEVARFWSSARYTSRAEAEALIARVEDAYRARRGIEWGIAEGEDGRLIGKVALYRWDREHFRAQVGYALNRAFWGRGYAREAVRAAVAFAFERLGVHGVEGHCDPQNHASASLLRQLGFRQEAHYRENYLLGGTFHDTAVFCLLEQDTLRGGTVPAMAPRRTFTGETT
jgi:ribosomal-protein-alanine N-acetyltransferase